MRGIGEARVTASSILEIVDYHWQRDGVMVAGNQFEPDYEATPGALLAEYLEARQMSQAELARPCGCSAELVREMVSGRASIKPAIATQFEMVLGVEAKTWLGIESRYQFLRAREA